MGRPSGWLLTLLFAATSFGCAPAVDSTAPEVPAAASVLVPLETSPLLRRLSLDLRGTVPTASELAAVQANPDALDGLVDEMFADPRFEQRLMRLYAEQFLTRVDELPVPGTDYGIDDEYAFVRAIGEEPLRLMAWVATHDRPWTEVVTADYTMSNSVLRGVFELEPIAGAEADGEGWTRSAYTDGRPAGGIVMTSGFWWRYRTTVGNRNRSRAAAISRLLLCQDILERPVEFGVVDLTNEDAAAEAVLTDPGCVTCHSAIDPIAASLFGFWWFDDKDAMEMAVYHQEREPMGEETLDVAPAYFGQPLDTPAELGWRISEDRRFARCTVQRAAQSLLRRDMDIEDYTQIESLTEAFLASGYSYPQLVRAILASGEYRAGALGETALELTAERVRVRRVVTVDQLASAVEDLTGFRWSWEGYDQLDNDDIGYRVLGGGVDGVYVNRPSPVPTLATTALLLRVAQAAAQTVVSHDLAVDGEARLLLPGGDLEAMDAGSDELAEAVAAVHLRVLSGAPDANRLADELVFWEQVAELEGSAEAWTGLVTVLLQDPEFLLY